MNEEKSRASEMRGALERFYGQAARVSPETLLKTVSTANIWFVNAEDYRKAQIAVSCGTGFNPEQRNQWADKLVSDALVLILSRLEQAAQQGFYTIVADEPSWEGGDATMVRIRDRLVALGFGVALTRVTRHRYCPHNNSEGEGCDYDSDSDGGAGEIAALQLTVSIPI